MTAARSAVDLANVPGYRWLENGQSVLSGALLELGQRLDRLFLRWAGAWGAEEYAFPTFLSARDMARLDYFRSFPHLATFPVALDTDEDNLRRFADREPSDGAGEVRLTAPAPIREVLTPAACYHFYCHYRGRTLAAPLYLTTRATCFRRESHYVPLERQWNFSMREIVCIGAADEVREFLAKCRAAVESSLECIELPVAWQTAADPFFDPSHNPKFLAQKLAPSKTEMAFAGRLALGSVNFHHDYFGDAFAIRRDGRAAFSGCVAFGVERWILAILTRFGNDERDWPNLEQWREGGK